MAFHSRWALLFDRSSTVLGLARSTDGPIGARDASNDYCSRGVEIVIVKHISLIDSILAGHQGISILGEHEIQIIGVRASGDTRDLSTTHHLVRV